MRKKIPIVQSFEQSETNRSGPLAVPVPARRLPGSTRGARETNSKMEIERRAPGGGEEEREGGHTGHYLSLSFSRSRSLGRSVSEPAIFSARIQGQMPRVEHASSHYVASARSLARP